MHYEILRNPKGTQKKTKETRKKGGKREEKGGENQLHDRDFKNEMISSSMTCQVGSLALSFTPSKNQSGAHECARKMCLLSPRTVNILSICQRSVKGFWWESPRKPLQIPEGNPPLVFSLPPTKGWRESFNYTAAGDCHHLAMRSSLLLLFIRRGSK